MKLASHNSWSYLKPLKWWMKLLRFTARCQDVDIQTQYSKYGVRCFDLRIKFNKGKIQVVHNHIVYDITLVELLDSLAWLNKKKNVAVRILLDVRSKKQYTPEQCSLFNDFCKSIEEKYKNIKFWEGRNLYDWKVEYEFSYCPTVKGAYSSVCSPRLIDDWWPRLYAKINNKKVLQEDTDKDYLMIDFVNYC